MVTRVGGHFENRYQGGDDKFLFVQTMDKEKSWPETLKGVWTVSSL
jgi:hypothetical protein